MIDFKFYMTRENPNGTKTPEFDLEEHFRGLRYVSCKGLSNKGKIKNVYSESYAESDGLRVYIGDAPIARESTDIEFEFAFIGDGRRELYDTFVNFVSGAFIEYRDTARKRKVKMFLVDVIEPNGDELNGSTPYIRAKFKFKNVNGSTTTYIPDRTAKKSKDVK